MQLPCIFLSIILIYFFYLSSIVALLTELPFQNCRASGRGVSVGTAVFVSSIFACQSKLPLIIQLTFFVLFSPLLRDIITNIKGGVFWLELPIQHCALRRGASVGIAEFVSAAWTCKKVIPEYSAYLFCTFLPSPLPDNTTNEGGSFVWSHPCRIGGLWMYARIIAKRINK